MVVSNKTQMASKNKQTVIGWLTILSRATETWDTHQSAAGVSENDRSLIKSTRLQDAVLLSSVINPTNPSHVST